MVDIHPMYRMDFGLHVCAYTYLQDLSFIFKFDGYYDFIENIK